MSLADTAAASSVTGPDYITVGKRGKPIKPRSLKYNIQNDAVSNRRTDLDSKTGSTLKKAVGISAPSQAAPKPGDPRNKHVTPTPWRYLPPADIAKNYYQSSRPISTNPAGHNRTDLIHDIVRNRLDHMASKIWAKDAKLKCKQNRKFEFDDLMEEISQWIRIAQPLRLNGSHQTAKIAAAEVTTEVLPPKRLPIAHTKQKCPPTDPPTRQRPPHPPASGPPPPQCHRPL